MNHWDQEWSMKEYPIQVEPHVDAKQVEMAVEKCSREWGF